MLAQAMQRRIAAMAGTGAIVTASGWAAIIAAAGAATSRRALGLMPSYTFAATALTAESCGYKPYFLDVEEENWMIFVALPTAIDLSHEAMERIVAALSDGRHQKTD